MATYLISFRIAQNATHAYRSNSTIEAIRREAIGRTTWEETTSLFLLQSAKSATDLATTIYATSGFDANTDKLLVVDMYRNTYATRGKIDQPATLASFFAQNTILGALRA
jgi:hypothetical protein